jgi:hypothetical protein
MMIDLLLLIPRAIYYGEWTVIGLGMAAIGLLGLIAFALTHKQGPHDD